jgi:hypothetical protein
MANEEGLKAATEEVAGAVEADKVEVTGGSAGAGADNEPSTLRHTLVERLNRAIRERSTLNMFVDVTLAGMLAASDATKHIELRREIAEILQEPDPFPTEEEFQERRDEAKRIEAFAREQAGRGFPYLFSSATVRLWSILEALVDDLGLAVLCHPDFQFPADSPLLKLEGPLVPFVNAPQEERAERISIALKQKLGAALKPGVARFEAFLEPLGLAGKVDDTVKRVLIELSSVRNVLVHKNGIADKRFVDACPWLELTLGSEILLTRNDFHMYGLAVAWYIVEISFRNSGRQTGRGVQVQARFMSAIDSCLKTERRLQFRSN